MALKHFVSYDSVKKGMRVWVQWPTEALPGKSASVPLRECVVVSDTGSRSVVLDVNGSRLTCESLKALWWEDGK